MIVTVEVDIAADGSMTVTPNPVGVASGDTIFFHVNSNASRGAKLSVDFPGGPESPFGEGDSRTTVSARKCLGAGSAVQWPPGVRSASVTLTVHGSPAIGKRSYTILNPAIPLSFKGGGGEPVAFRKSTDCGPPKASAGPTWGPWDRSEATATTAALTRVRTAVKAQKTGKCAAGKTCVYREDETSTPQIETRTVDNATEYRVEASTKGGFQCE